jgi:GTPase SAR1 family protein
LKYTPHVILPIMPPGNPAAPAPGVSKAGSKESSPYAAREIYIAVMGETGTGKSSFINLVTGQNLKVGHDLSYCTLSPPSCYVHISLTWALLGTEAIQTASTIIDGINITFIDTPGTDECSRDDSEIIRLLGAWLKMSDCRNGLLNGIIFLHRITDRRFGGSSFRTLHNLKRICGTINFQNFALVTTMWDLLPTEEEGEMRERKLKQGTADGWSYMITNGAQTFRHYGKRDTAMEVVKLYLPKNPVLLDLQELLSKNDGIVEGTAAGKFITDYLKLQSQPHTKHLSDLGGQAALNAKRLPKKACLHQALSFERLEVC